MAERAGDRRSSWFEGPEWRIARIYLEPLKVAIVVITPDETIAWANSACCELLGWPSHEVIGANWFDHFIPAHLRGDVRSVFVQIMKGTIEPFVSYENPILRRDGTERMVSWHNAYLRDRDGAIQASISTGIDITELMQTYEALAESERRFRGLFEQAPDGILVADAQTKSFVMANEEICRMLGYERDELLTMGLKDIHPHHRVADQEAAFERLASGASMVSANVPLKRRDGSELIVDIKPCRLSMAGRQGLVGFFRDVTPRLRWEEETRKRESLESLSLLAGGIAHDFNNLLTAIAGNLELALSDDEWSTASRERVVAAREAAARAQKLTVQLLTFAKGGAPIRKAASVDQLCSDVATFILSGSPCRLDLQVTDELWPAVIDAGQISQVMENLLINASQAMPQGGTVTVKIGNHTEADEKAFGVGSGQFVKIEVIDQGHGIQRDDLGKIFDPYFTTKNHGSGLGLAVTSSIIRRHGGSIDVDSTPGKGTTFTVLLPAAPGAEVAREDDGAVISKGGGSILVMDDQPEVLAVFEAMLAHLGFDVALTSEGREAFARFMAARQEGRPFDLVITDLTVQGGVGGLGLLRMLKAEQPDVRVVVSSGYSGDQALSEHKKHGFCAALVKPFTLKGLSTVLQEALESEDSQGPTQSGPSA